jgi:hypothetical protein
VGKSGQYDIVVDGQVVASREGNLLTRLMGGGWPEPGDVLATIEKRVAKKA